ncbi:nitroreductase family protein [Hoylesella timonensis]|uniref:nitroreductase family protein n=1 Tax=Hoylesella timonensis TaxID=386414 RepID=UPI0012FD2339
MSDDAIREIVECTIKHVPSPFNSQSARLVVLRSEHHQKVRELTKDVLRLVL